MSIQREQVGKLEQQTQLNYQAAMNYYAQKRAQFLKMAVTKEQQNEKEFINNYSQVVSNSIQTILIDSWKKIYNQVVSAAQIGDIKTGFKYTVDETKLQNIPQWLKESVIKGQGLQNLYSLMGFNYEYYAEQAMRSIGQEIIRQGYQDCMSQFYRTADFKSRSAMRSGFLDIRADLGRGIEQVGKIVRETGGTLAAELQTEFSIEEHIINEATLINDDVLIQQYLRSGMFGVSMKLWALENSSNKSFTEASGIKNKLNQQFNTKRTWNNTYAVQMANKVVSNYLLDIIGPINIALFTGTGMMWMDDFIGNNLFTMTVYAKNNRFYKKNGILNEIKPEVRDSSIFIRRYAMSKAIANQKAMVSSTRLLTKDSKKYRVAMQLKRI